MNTRRIKLCALCDNKIPHNHVVCPTHYKEYALYKNEQWFIELVKMQRKQAEIDRKECVTIHKLSENSLSTYLGNLSTGKNKHNKDIIIELYNKGMRPVDIAKELRLNRYTVTKIVYRFKKSGQRT